MENLMVANRGFPSLDGMNRGICLDLAPERPLGLPGDSQRLAIPRIEKNVVTVHKCTRTSNPN
ncbi:hypothetical protein I7I48_01645 [Histoplasma ohiense]|nr:hypothetical protein I7I48_01645 [Histoplasma ohiense (nom. inval.)]